MASDGSRRFHSSASQPPRKINVQKFAEARSAEVESLYSTIANRVDNDFRSRRNKRRRTTSFDNQVAKKRFRKRQKLSNGSGSKKKEEMAVPRRIRRRLELKKNPEIGFSTSGDGNKRLRTHVWHAKRFSMKKMWGFYLPLGLQGRGRGSRALLKWFREGVLIHDASYHVALQLEGPEKSLMAILEMVLTPSPSSLSKYSSHSIRSGHSYGAAMLHHVGEPFPQAIAPVTYMLRHHRNNTENDCYNHDAGLEGGSRFRQLWLWIHASAFSEGYDALKCATEKLMKESGVSVNCFSREGELAKLELFGPKAFQLLKETFHSHHSNSEDVWQLVKCSVARRDSQFKSKSFSVLENEELITSNAVLPFTVMDPRYLPDKIAPGVPEHVSTSGIPEVESIGLDTATKYFCYCEESVSPSWSKPKGDDCSSSNLWDASSGTSPPVEEQVVCEERHQRRRMDLFCLDDPKSEATGTTNKGMDLFCLDNPKSEALGTSNKDCSRSCPLMILKSNKEDLPMGWSVILPLSWVKVFWVFLISKGARAIGQREKRWIACDMGLPYFPSDFPDCKAYLSLLETEAAASKQNVEQHPPAIRPFRVPIPSPWNVIRYAIDNVSMRVQDTQDSCEANCVNGDSLTMSNCPKSEVASVCHPFEGFIERTSNTLTDFLNGIHTDRLLLFPQNADGKNNLVKFMKDESLLRQDRDGIRQISQNRKLCLLRVKLHAFKEGTFEEGAVVCAPRFSDISLWTSSSGSIDGRLEMPQSLVSSYFKELPCGNWELQIPEDPASRESFRWPVGFVTTGFVRGSKKPVAEAYCDTVLLTRLREEQWKGMPVKRRRKEIYVLVRNLRSSAYRLALATIVLEQREDDVLFM